MSKKRRVWLAAGAFVGVCVFSAFVCWCGGFNFNHRDPDVGFGVFFALFMAGAAAIRVWIFPTWEE